MPRIFNDFCDNRAEKMFFSLFVTQLCLSPFVSLIYLQVEFHWLAVLIHTRQQLFKYALSPLSILTCWPQPVIEDYNRVITSFMPLWAGLSSNKTTEFILGIMRSLLLCACIYLLIKWSHLWLLSQKMNHKQHPLHNRFFCFGSL